MQYILAVFKSRNETLYLANLLMQKGYSVNIINTPREIGPSCGISVQFAVSLLEQVRLQMTTKPFRSFYGFYKVERKGARTSVVKL